MKSMTAGEIAKLVGAESALEARVSRVAAIEVADADAVVFALDDSSLKSAIASKAGVILATKNDGEARVMVVRDPKYAFALCGRALKGEAEGPLVHAAASVDATAKLGAGSRVSAGAVIEAGVVIGVDCEIGSRAVICAGAVLGDRVVVQAGAVIGSTGFGYARNADTGEYLLFPQQGKMIVEDDVEIGANTTIDRGALGETRIGRGTKIDNLVHIGHNCLIGKNVVMASQVGISGSCVVGDGAVLAGQVGLGDHVTIGPGVILGGASGVFPHKTVTGPGEMFMGVPAEPLKDYLKTVAKMRRLNRG